MSINWRRGLEYGFSYQTLFLTMDFDYIAYCDGSFQSSIDCGGWSSVIIKDNKIIKKLYQGYRHTTNNRMEIMGVLETLRYFKTPVSIKIYSDSQYVVNSIVNKYVYNWFEAKDFTKKNLDLWFELIDLLEFHNVTLEWVKGHDGNEFNNLADKLAVHAAQCLNIPEDEINTVNF